MLVHVRIAFVVLTGCANAGMPVNNLGDDNPGADAPVSTHQDAPSHVNNDTLPPIDAPGPPDAFVFQDAPIDAASALFCSVNSECTNSGECCITLGGPAGFCGPGIVIGTACIPQ